MHFKRIHFISNTRAFQKLQGSLSRRVNPSLDTTWYAPQFEGIHLTVGDVLLHVVGQFYFITILIRVSLSVLMTIRTQGTVIGNTFGKQLWKVNGHDLHCIAPPFKTT